MSSYFYIRRWKGEFLFLGVFGYEKNLLVYVSTVRYGCSKLAGECGGLPAPCSGIVVEPVIYPGADLVQKKGLVKCSVASHRHLGLNYFNMLYLKKIKAELFLSTSTVHMKARLS